jgi:hypothetical protein
MRRLVSCAGVLLLLAALLLAALSPTAVVATARRGKKKKKNLRAPFPDRVLLVHPCAMATHSYSSERFGSSDSI